MPETVEPVSSAIALEVNTAYGRVVVDPEQVEDMIAERALAKPLDQEVMEAVFRAMSTRGL